MKKQLISRENLGELYKLVDNCNTYKSKIETYLKKDMFAHSFEISQAEIDEAFSQANSSQREALLKYFKKSETPQDRINSWKDVLKELKITESSLNLIKNPKTKENKSRNALIKLFCIVKAYNRGWIPDWKNTNQYKYYNYFSLSGGSWLVGCSYGYFSLHAPSGLYFESSQSASDAISKFREIYNDYFMI